MILKLLYFFLFILIIQITAIQQNVFSYIQLQIKNTFDIVTICFIDESFNECVVVQY